MYDIIRNNGRYRLQAVTTTWRHYQLVVHIHLHSSYRTGSNIPHIRCCDQDLDTYVSIPRYVKRIRPSRNVCQKLWYCDIKTVLDKASIYIEQNCFAHVHYSVPYLEHDEDSSHNMEELPRLQASHKGYKSHVTRTLTHIEELMGAKTIDEFQLTSLMTVSQQLQKRKETIV